MSQKLSKWVNCMVQLGIKKLITACLNLHSRLKRYHVQQDRWVFIDKYFKNNPNIDDNLILELIKSCNIISVVHTILTTYHCKRLTH